MEESEIKVYVCFATLSTCDGLEQKVMILILEKHLCTEKKKIFCLVKTDTGNPFSSNNICLSSERIQNLPIVRKASLFAQLGKESSSEKIQPDILEHSTETRRFILRSNDEFNKKCG